MTHDIEVERIAVEHFQNVVDDLLKDLVFPTGGAQGIAEIDHHVAGDLGPIVILIRNRYQQGVPKQDVVGPDSEDAHG
jgi:hypothetical protein